MSSNLRAGTALDRLLERGSPTERGIVEATAILEVACRERLYDLDEGEAKDLRVALHGAADLAMKAWVGAFVVALERFEAAHPGLHVHETAAS
ncbi:MAG TPA: hypothetical protein VEY67_11120 [Candidatus Dormibacteraeota bacterium]|nr:hypothetical protein [Candidatus Dormibacteraeota bacterium]